MEILRYEGPYARIIKLVFCGAFVVIGLIAMSRGLLWRLEVRSMSRWPRAPGRMQSGTVDTRKDDYGNITYVAEFQYSYWIGGVHFIGTRYGAGDDVVPAADVERVKETFRTGAETLVYYDPDNPADSVLEPIANASGAI